MPFTFSTSEFTKPLADFGNDAAQMILQTGATIQQGLHSMMTNRQVASLGQELGQLNPESPEWAQQAIKMGSRYPLAMKSPAGQFMLSTQAKANAEWRQAQRATAQADTMMRRQVGLENLRTENDIKLEGIKQKNRMEQSGSEMMDLTVPRAMGGAPATFGTDETQFQNTEELAGASQLQVPRTLGRGVPLFGAEEDINALAPADRVRQSLVAEGITKIPAKEFRAAVAGERRMENSRAMQEDRQRQTETSADRRAAEAEKSRLASEERTLKSMNATTLRQARDDVDSRISSIKRKLDSDFDETLEAIETDSAGKQKGLSKEQTVYFRRRKALEDELKELTGKYEKLTTELDQLGGKSSTVLRFDPATGKLVPR